MSKLVQEARTGTERTSCSIKYIPLLKVFALFNHRRIKVGNISGCRLVEILAKSRAYFKRIFIVLFFLKKKKSSNFSK